MSFSSSPRPQCFRLGQSLNDARRVSAAVHDVSLAEPDSPPPAAGLHRCLLDSHVSALFEHTWSSNKLCLRWAATLASAR